MGAKRSCISQSQDEKDDMMSEPERLVGSLLVKATEHESTTRCVKLKRKGYSIRKEGGPGIKPSQPHCFAYHSLVQLRTNIGWAGTSSVADCQHLFRLVSVPAVSTVNYTGSTSSSHFTCGSYGNS